MSDRITANDWRNCTTKLLTVDATVRSLPLSPGRYFLMGDAAQIVRFALRYASDAIGTLSAGEVAPASLAAPTAGTPAVGSAWGAGAPVSGVAEVQADITAHRQIDVPEGHFMVLYVSATAAATPKLIGPVHWHLVNNNSEAH